MKEAWVPRLNALERREKPPGSHPADQRGGKLSRLPLEPTSSITWLISHSLMLSGSIHASAKGRSSLSYCYYSYWLLCTVGWALTPGLCPCLPPCTLYSLAITRFPSRYLMTMNFTTSPVLGPCCLQWR